MADPVQSNNPGAGKDPEVPDAEKALAQTWQKKVKHAKKLAEDRNKALKVLRQYVNGEQHDDGAKGLVRTNLIFATIASLLPYVYAKDPDLAVSPSEAVQDGQYEVVKRFCKTLELVLRRLLVKDGRLKKRAKSNVRATMTTGVGWLKVLYQRDYKTDPIIQNRIADIQDNIKRMEYLSSEVASDNAADREAKKAELVEQLKALQAHIEVAVAEGMVIDRVMTEDMLVLDDAIRDFDMYQQARALAHGIWFSKESYAEMFGHDAPTGATTYKQPSEEKDGKSGEDLGAEFVRVWEIWDRISQTIYTMVEGASGFCRPPYQPRRQGERWYPFFALGFNLVDGQFMPLSDVALLKELQDEYNTTRTNFAEHRAENIPGTVVRSGGQLTPEDIERIKNRKINETIIVEGDGNRPLSDDIQNISGTAIDPAVYDVTPIRSDMDMVAGIGDASRSNLIQPKTATEAEIMREGLMSRTAERQDANEDFMQEICQYSAEILLQELTTAQVQRIAGVAYTWPVMSKNEIFDLVNIEIRAGSTGKPNRMRERQQWLEFLPRLQEAVVKIMELRAQGQNDLAQGLIEMLKETLKRFDERLDLDSFIPGTGRGQAGNQGAEMAQMLQQVQGRLQQVQAENVDLKKAADANQAKIQIAGGQQQLDREEALGRQQAEGAAITSKERVAIHEADVKAVAAERSKNAQIEANKQIEQEKIASNERIEIARINAAPAVAPGEGGGEVVDGNADQAAQSSQLTAAIESLGKLADEFRLSMTEVAAVMGADRVAVRDASGKVQRTRIERRPVLDNHP
jgi:hypothetical protein